MLTAKFIIISKSGILKDAEFDVTFLDRHSVWKGFLCVKKYYLENSGPKNEKLLFRHLE